MVTEFAVRGSSDEVATAEFPGAIAIRRGSKAVVAWQKSQHAEGYVFRLDSGQCLPDKVGVSGEKWNQLVVGATSDVRAEPAVEATYKGGSLTYHQSPLADQQRLRL